MALLIKISTLSTYLQCHIVFVAKKSAVSARAPDPSARAAVWECEHLVLQSAARHPAAARLKKLSQHLRRRSQSVRSVVRAEPEHTRHSGAGIEGRSLVRGTLTFVPPSSCGARAPATSDTRDILASSQSRSETGRSPTSVAGFDTKRGENLPYEKSSYIQWASVIYKEASIPARVSPENGTVSFKVSGELLILMSEHLTTNNNPSFRIGVRLWACLLLGTLVNSAMAQGKIN